MSSLITFFDIITKILSLYSLLISVPLYIASIAVVFKNRNETPFNSTFFTLFFYLGVIDITCFFAYLIPKGAFWMMFPSLYEPIGQSNLFGKISNYFIWTTGLTQYLLIVLVATNRHSAVCWPLQYKSIWTKKNVKIMVSICLLWSVVLCSPILFTDVTFGTTTLLIGNQNVTFTYGPAFMTISYNTIYYGIWEAYTYILIVSSFLLYGTATAKLINQHRQHRTEQSGIELKFFFAGFTIFLTCILYVTYYFARVYLENKFPEFGSNQLAQCILFIFSDLFDLNNVYLMLFFSRDLRVKVFASLSCRENAVAPEFSVRT